MPRRAEGSPTTSMTILASQLQLHRPVGWEGSPAKQSVALSRASSSAAASPARQSGSMPPAALLPPSLTQVGGMVPLVKLLGAAYEDSIITLAAAAVAGLAVDPSNSAAFREAGGLPSLVWLIKVRVIHLHHFPSGPHS